ncbi:MAG: hypothetical protein RIS70_2448 [Planctomycetota bacterium]
MCIDALRSAPLLALFLLLPCIGGEPTNGLQFEERLIAGGYGYAYGIAAVDIDGDGDLDVTSADTRRDVLYWYENDGKGNFSRRIVRDAEPGWFERHAVGDLNGDGLPDIVVVKNLEGHLVWFENNGKPGLDKDWTRHVLTTDLKRAYDVVLVDLNADGRLDVAAAAWNGNYHAWFANPGPGKFDEEWKKEMIDQEIGETRTIATADFNGDKKPDLLGTARIGNLTAWYEQTGDAARPWKRHVIDDQSPLPVHGQPIDMDGDGDPDVVMALGMHASEGMQNTNQIVWYENPRSRDNATGENRAWKKHLIGPMPYGFEVYPGDLDGDGDLDVAATAWGGAGQIAWFENPGQAGGEWKRHALKEPWNRANQVLIADLDGDRRLDILASAEVGANEVRWWKNLGAKK